VRSRGQSSAVGARVFTIIGVTSEGWLFRINPDSRLQTFTTHIFYLTMIAVNLSNHFKKLN